MDSLRIRTRFEFAPDRRAQKGKRSMRSLLVLCVAAAAIGLLTGAADMPAGTPQYDANGRLLFPDDYRQWTFLSSSMDMSYVENAPPAGVHIFNNVFVPRDAYESFLKNGLWPDKAVLLTEHRIGATNLSILKHGQIQTTNIVGFEAHVKDTRFAGGWAFFGFGNGQKSAGEIPHTTDCYSCHEAHAAADTTFVQFYPTLLPVATSLKTLNPSYVAETAAPKSN
jgi:cytochrome P460